VSWTVSRSRRRTAGTGPYVKKGTDSRSLGNEEQLFTLTLAEAKDLFSQPKARGRARGAAAPPLRELGDDPGSGKRWWSRAGDSAHT